MNTAPPAAWFLARYTQSDAALVAAELPANADSSDTTLPGWHAAALAMAET